MAFLIFAFIVALYLAILAGSAFILSLLWNWIIPLFIPAIHLLTFWEALGLMLLLGIIGGFFKSKSKS